MSQPAMINRFFPVPVLLISGWIATPTQAQIIPAQDGTATQILTTGNQIEVLGGTRSRDRTNLFHSFEKFGITSAQIVNLQSDPTIRNIFMRVSGGEASVMDGVLKISNGSSNLFLMNPAGILFGSTAKLNLPAAFSATTATGIAFENGSFNATGAQNYEALTGNPTQLKFAIAQPAAIANLGQISASSISLTGGTVLNTGALSAPNGLTIAAIPGTQQVRIAQAGNVMNLEIQSLNEQTLKNWNPATLPQLLTKSSNITNATELTITPDGKVQLSGSGTVISDQSNTVVLSGTSDTRSAGPMQVVGNQIVVFPNAIATAAGDVRLSARDRIFFERNSSPNVFLGEGGKVTFSAGNRFVSDLNLFSGGRSIEIQSPTIQTQAINTALAGNSNGGSVTIRGLNQTFAEQASVGNIITPNQPVSIQAKQISSQFILTSATSNGIANGSVNLQSQGVLRVGGILTNGQPVELSTAMEPRSGYLQSGTIRTTGGAVTLKGDRINAGLIWTSPNTTNGSAGNVSLTAHTDLRASRIEANGKGTGQAGTVELTNQTGNVLLDSIQAYGGQQGGHVTVQGDRIQIVGRNSIQLDGTVLGDSQTTSSVRAGESITIRHQGGKLNQPFIVGNPALNGTAGSLQVGDRGLSDGTFPIQAKTTEYRPVNQLLIAAENDAPTFSLDDQAIQLFLKPGQSTQFTLADLGIPLPRDRNQDQISILLRPKSQFLASGGKLLDANGLPVSPDRPIQLSDRLTYVAPQQSSGVFDAFEVTAIDVPLTADFSTAAARVPLRFDDVSLLPQTEPAAPQPDASTTVGTDSSSISTISSEELAAMDNQLSQDFQAAGIQGSAGGSDPTVVTRQMEKQTGVRSAFVYLRSTKTQGADELIITLATAKGRFQKRIPLTATEFNAAISQFRREVTNPLRTHTTSYLQPAKQLYRWIMTPIVADLKAQGITNLIFLPDAGLRSLPYSALHDGRQFLIEQFSIGLMPSLGLTQTTYQNLHRSNILAVGVSEATQGQAPLPMVKTELSAIAQLWNQKLVYLNQEATPDNLRTARQRNPFQIVHLATHANFKAGAPKEAYIQLWNQQLKLEQIREFNWNNPPVELLVLSACRTAIGDRESELGFAGLTVQTGVKTTVASLWYVNDTATTALISKFYDALKDSPVKVEALRQAQLAMARGEIAIADGKLTGFRKGLDVSIPDGLQVSDPNFRHPYYWAAFTMVGNPW